MTAVSKKQIDLRVATADIGSVLLSEVELLLEHGAEHRALAHGMSQGSSWTSPAWSVVTLYYWAFFSALALTRLVGDTIWFLNAEAAKTLTTMASGTGAAMKVGSGAYRLTVGPGDAPQEAVVSLRQSKDRLHEAVWKRAHAHLDDALHGADETSNRDEFRLLNTLSTSVKKLGEDWPSTVRNHVNYRPGFAYREVRRKGNPDAVKFLRKYPHPSWNTALDEMEAATATVNRQGHLEDPSAELGRLLASFAVLVHGYALALYEEASDRSGRGREWRQAHKAFLTRRGMAGAGAHWPLADSA